VLLTRELLDAVVVTIGDEDVPARIHGNTGGTAVAELPVPATRAAPRSEEGPGVRERHRSDARLLTTYFVLAQDSFDRLLSPAPLTAVTT
jgi:hypothetical protein